MGSEMCIRDSGVGGALILQNAVSNKYNRVINREGLNSLQALMRRPFNGTPVAISKAGAHQYGEHHCDAADLP